MKHVNFADYPEHYIQTVTLSDGESYIPDFSNARIFRLNCSGAVTLENPLNAKDGLEMRFELTGMAAGTSVTFGDAYVDVSTLLLTTAQTEIVEGRYRATKSLQTLGVTGGIFVQRAVSDQLSNIRDNTSDAVIRGFIGDIVVDSSDANGLIECYFNTFNDTWVWIPADVFPKRSFVIIEKTEDVNPAHVVYIYPDPDVFINQHTNADVIEGDPLEGLEITESYNIIVLQHKGDNVWSAWGGE